jgi:hypothetical protein
MDMSEMFTRKRNDPNGIHTYHSNSESIETDGNFGRRKRGALSTLDGCNS